jgi:hypothetical protein
MRNRKSRLMRHIYTHSHKNTSSDEDYEILRHPQTIVITFLLSTVVVLQEPYTAVTISTLPALG